MMGKIGSYLTINDILLILKKSSRYLFGICLSDFLIVHLLNIIAWVVVRVAISLSKMEFPCVGST